MQLSFWALSIAGFGVLFSSATPVERPKAEQLPSTTTNVTSFPSVSSLIPTSLSATPQNTSPSPTTTTFSRQTTTTTNQPGIPLPPSTVTAQVPTSRPDGEHECGGEPIVKRLNKRDHDGCDSW